VTPNMAGLHRDGCARQEGTTAPFQTMINTGVQVAENDTVACTDSCASWLQVPGGSGSELHSPYRGSPDFEDVSTRSWFSHLCTMLLECCTAVLLPHLQQGMSVRQLISLLLCLHPSAGPR
jgi:hypothetical protein